MTNLLFGITLLVVAAAMLRMARPGPDGRPVRFLSRDSMETLYSLAITGFIGVGIALAIEGAVTVAAVR